MSQVVTYKNEGPKGCYCQIKLDSRERILLSIAESGIVIFKLVLRGYIPVKKIWEAGPTVAYHKFGPFDSSKISNLSRLPGAGHPLDVMKDRLLGFSSITELQTFLEQEEAAT